MAKFLDAANIKEQVPKLVETQDGYIFNGTMYDKKTSIPESLKDLATYGSDTSLSLNRVASYPVLSTSKSDSYQSTFFKGDAIIEDEFDSDIYYTITFDYSKACYNSLSYLTKYSKANNKTTKIISKKIGETTDTSLWGNVIQLAGQTKEALFFIVDSCKGGNIWNMGSIMKVNKTTLKSDFVVNTGYDRMSYSKILSTGNIVYLYVRKHGSNSSIVEFNMSNNATKTIITIPAYSSEQQRLNFVHPLQMSSDTTGYILDMPAHANPTFIRWIDINLQAFRPAISANGIPNAINLKKEAAFTLNGYNCYGSYSPCPVFDKDNVNGHSHSYASTFYWNSTSAYLDVTFESEVNIWRSGTSSYPNYNAHFIIKKWNDDTSTWDVVTSEIQQSTTEISNSAWEKTISNLPAGRYRFEMASGKYRMDSCWYVEDVNGEYSTEEIFGIVDSSCITYQDIDFTISCDASKLEPMVVTSGNLANVANNSFIINADGVKYFNITNYGLSGSNWGADYTASNVTTFRIDEENHSLDLTGQCQLSHTNNVCRAYALSSNSQRLLGMSGTNTFVLDFDRIMGKFTLTKSFAYASYSCGFDKKDNIWILNKSKELIKINDNIPENIRIEFEETNLEYEGNNVETFIEVDAINFIGKRITSKIALKINGNAVFSSTGNSEIEIETLDTDKLNIPLTITGSGIIMIYPTLILNMKQD